VDRRGDPLPRTNADKQSAVTLLLASGNGYQMRSCGRQFLMRGHTDDLEFTWHLITVIRSNQSIKGRCGRKLVERLRGAQTLYGHVKPPATMVEAS